MILQFTNMSKLSARVLLYLSLAVAYIATLEVQKYEKSLADKIMGNYEETLKFEPGLKPSNEELERLVQDYFLANKGRDMKTTLKSFSWNDCGGSAGRVFNLTVSPDPLHAGNITVAVNATITKELDSPLKTELTIEIHIVVAWVKVPCIDGIGSCTYDDICQKLKGVTCPGTLTKHNITCHCPFKPQKDVLPPSMFNLPAGPPEGKYRAMAKIYDTKGNMVICLNISELDFD